MNRVSASLIAAGLLAVSGSAFADDATPGAAPPAAPVTAPAAAPAGELNDAPLVAPMGKLSVYGTLPILAVPSISIDPTTGAITQSTSTDVGIAFGATYGIADKLEGGIEYAHTLSPSSGNGLINVHAAYAALHNDKLDVALAADFVADFDSGGPVILQVGAWARYHLAPKISLYTGNPGLAHTTPQGGSSAAGFFGFPSSYQLAFGLNNGNDVLLALPVGVGFQASPQLYAFASTTIADFEFNGGSNAFIFSDFIPIGVGAFYSVSDKLEVGAEFSDDLKNAGDFYSIAFMARYWAK